MKAAKSEYPAKKKLCIVNTPEAGKVNRLALVNTGHGDGDTKWKGWPWNKLLFKFDIFIS